jgi:hypothetical protein
MKNRLPILLFAALAAFASPCVLVIQAAPDYSDTDTLLERAVNDAVMQMKLHRQIDHEIALADYQVEKVAPAQFDLAWQPMTDAPARVERVQCAVPALIVHSGYRLHAWTHPRHQPARLIQSRELVDPGFWFAAQRV